MAETVDFETRTPEQLPPATAVSPLAWTVVQEPSGPVQKVSVKQLLGRLIQTDTAFETEAAPGGLQGSLNHPANEVALVYADPTPAKNGWYRKVGAAGAGNWQQFEKLSSFAAAEVQLLVAECASLRDQTIAAASAVLVASYANGGTGDRTASVTVRTSPGLLDASSTANRLVNGSTSGNSYANAIAFANVAVAGHWFELDRGYGADKLWTEFKWYQTSAATHGTWQGYVVDRKGVKTAVGGTFVLGGSAAATIATFAANLKPGQIARFEGVAGNTNTGGAPFIYEIEERLVGTLVDGRAALPTAGRDRQIARWKSSSAGVAWDNFPFLKLPALATATYLAEYRFDGEGTVEENKLAAGLSIDFGATHQATYGAPPKRTGRGLLFARNMIRTETLTNCQTIVRLVRKKLATSGLYDLGVGVAGEPIYMQGSTFNGTSTIRHITAEGTVAALRADVSGAAGSSGWALNRGGWTIECIQAAAPFSGRIGIGGHPTGTSASSRSDEMEIAALIPIAGTISDAEFLAIATEYLRPLAISRGIYPCVDDNPVVIKGTLAIGQSMIVGDPELKDLEDWKRAALAFVEDVWFWAAAKGTAPNFNLARSKVAGRLRVGGNNWPDDLPRTAEHFGFEVGWALARREAFNTTGEEALFKGGLNGTYLAGPASGVGGNSMHPALPKASGYFDYLLREIGAFQHYLNLRGIGIRWRHLAFAQGQQECNAAQSEAPSLSRQADLQAFWDTLKAQLGNPAGLHMTIEPVHPNAAPTAYSPTYIANSNAGTAAFDAANADVSSIVVNDLVLTPASTVNSRTVDGITYPPIVPLEVVDQLHFPVIDQQAKDRRHRAAALAAGF